MPNMEAVSIARILVEGVICRLGFPYIVHTDQGSQFESWSLLCSGPLSMMGSAIGDQHRLQDSRTRDYIVYTPNVLMIGRETTTQWTPSIRSPWRLNWCHETSKREWRKRITLWGNTRGALWWDGKYRVVLSVLSAMGRSFCCIFRERVSPFVILSLSTRSLNLLGGGSSLMVYRHGIHKEYLLQLMFDLKRLLRFLLPIFLFMIWNFRSC